MKKALLIAAVAALFIGGLVFAQTTVTNRGDVITVNTMVDLPESTETNMAVTEAVWAIAVTDDASVGGDLDVDGAAVLASAEVEGTLAVTGVATLSVAPVLTAVTAAGAETATMTNAPAAGNPVVWANVTVGTNTYVIPLFAAE